MLAIKKHSTCTGNNCKCHICRELIDCPINLPRIEAYKRPMDSTNFILRRAIPFVKRTPSKEWQEATKFDNYDSMSTLEDRTKLPVQLKSLDKSELKQGKPVKSPRPSLSSSLTSVNVHSLEDESEIVQPNRPTPPKPLPKPRIMPAETKIECDVNNKIMIYFGEKHDEFNGDTTIKSESLWSLGQTDSLNVNADNVCVDKDINDGQLCQDNVTCGNDSAEIIVRVSPSREDILKIEEDETRLEEYWSLPGDTTGFKADWSFVQQWRLRG